MGTDLVCETDVLVVVMSVAQHSQSVDAVGIVTVQVPVLLVPTFTLKAAVPFFVTIDAAEPPQPAPAIVGADADQVSAPVAEPINLSSPIPPAMFVACAAPGST